MFSNGAIRLFISAVNCTSSSLGCIQTAVPGDSVVVREHIYAPVRTPLCGCGYIQSTCDYVQISCRTHRHTHKCARYSDKSVLNVQAKQAANYCEHTVMTLQASQYSPSSCQMLTYHYCALGLFGLCGRLLCAWWSSPLPP